MSDPSLTSEVQPESLKALGARLKKAYGVGADNFGIKGNEYHTSGYHRSYNFLIYSYQGNGGDYSTSGSLNHGDYPDYCCAFDFTPGSWGTSDNRARMIELTKRLRAAARRNDRRLDAYYEFAGTEDGMNVVTFYAQGGAAKSPFDSSHLDHIHGSKYRSRAEWDDTGLGDIMLGVGESTGEGDDMGSFVIQDIEVDGATSLSIPKVPSAGGWVHICNDVGNAKYGLRIFFSRGDGGWLPASKKFGTTEDPGNSGKTVDDAGRIALGNGQAFTIGLPQGTRCVSIFRQKLNPSGAFDDSDAGSAYQGPLTVAVERGPVPA